MAAADALIIRDGPVAVPLAYQVPASAELVPIAVSATFDDPNNAGSYVPALVILTPDGQQLGPYPLASTIAAGASARVSWFPHVAFPLGVAIASGAALESFFFDTITAAGTPVYSATTLAVGVLYTVTVQGTYTEWPTNLTEGSPNPDALYPGSTAGRVSTQVGIDPECCFAAPSGPPGKFIPGKHTDNIELGVGSGFAHVEPVGGPFSTPQANYAYTYQFTGQGAPLGIQNKYSPTSDNYGKLLVTIQGGTGGGGSLVPPTNAGNNGQVMLTAAGVAVWGNVDGGAP